MSDYGWKWRIWSLKKSYFRHGKLIDRRELVANSKKAFFYEIDCRSDGEEAKRSFERRDPNNGPYELTVYNDEDPKVKEFNEEINYLTRELGF